MSKISCQTRKIEVSQGKLRFSCSYRNGEYKSSINHSLFKVLLANNGKFARSRSGEMVKGNGASYEVTGRMYIYLVYSVV